MSQSDELSNSEVETTARETLNRCGLLLDGTPLRVEPLLSLSLNLLTTFLLVVFAFHIL